MSSAGPFAQGMRVQQFGEFRHGGDLLTASEARLGVVLDRGEAQLDEAGDVRGEERGIGEFGQVPSAPQFQGLRQQDFGGGGIGDQDLSSLTGEAGEQVRIDRVRVDGEAVTAWAGFDGGPGVVQHAPQPGHLSMQGIGRVGPPAVRVQSLDQPVSADGPAGLQQQEREYGPAFRAADSHGGSVGATYLDRAQDTERRGCAGTRDHRGHLDPWQWGPPS
jgi:hypothetical protein